MKILLAYDGSAEARRALEWAARLARGGADSSVTVVTVARSLEAAPHIPDAVDPATTVEQQRGYLDQAVSQLEAEGVRVARVLKMGGPAEQILDASDEHDADVIVIGHQGLGAVRRFLMGSVAERVTRHATRPVLIVR